MRKEWKITTKHEKRRRKSRYSFDKWFGEVQEFAVYVRAMSGQFMCLLLFFAKGISIQSSTHENDKMLTHTEIQSITNSHIFIHTHFCCPYFPIPAKHSNELQYYYNRHWYWRLLLLPHFIYVNISGSIIYCSKREIISDFFILLLPRKKNNSRWISIWNDETCNRQLDRKHTRTHTRTQKNGLKRT